MAKEETMGTQKITQPNLGWDVSREGRVLGVQQATRGAGFA